MKLVRVKAWIDRFRYNACSSKRTNREGKRTQSKLTEEELDNAKTFWIMYVQRLSFSSELSDLSEKGEVSTKSRLKNLRPFIDKDRLIRVGG